MNKTKLKRIVCSILAAFMLVGAMPVITDAYDGSIMSNTVIYVGFSDTQHNHYDSIYGKCFLIDPKVDELYNGGGKLSLKQYLYHISFGSLTVNSVFPQLGSNGRIIPCILDNTTAYYANCHTDVLVHDVIEKMSAQIGGLNIDANQDGIVDNLQIVVPCESGNSNSMFYGLATSYAGSNLLAGKRVATYNIITESGAYLSNGQSGLPIHEFLHSIGYPDLYRERGSNSLTVSPVYTWDIMSTESMYLQYPLAAVRKNVSNWLAIPEITSSMTNYSLTSVGVADENPSLKNNIAVILKTAYSSSEYFVVEFRQKTTAYERDGNGNITYNNEKYDLMIPGSGLVIYRVNENANERRNNQGSGPLYLYVFRPGDTYGSNGIEMCGGEVSQSFLSLESGRTQYGSALESATLQDGALTYSDGTNSGIVISNVGSANGDTIQFDITFNNVSAVSTAWSSEGEYGQNLYDMATAISDNGTIYYAANGKLLAYSEGVFQEMCSLPIGNEYQLAWCQGTLYLGYLDSSFKVRLAQYENGTFSSIRNFSDVVNSDEWRICSDGTSIFLGYISNNTAKYYIYDGTIHALGSHSANNGANLRITASNGGLFSAYREWTNGNKLVIHQINNGNISEVSCNINSSDVEILAHEGYLYALSTDYASSSSIFCAEIGVSDFSKIGNDFADHTVTASNLFFVGNVLYLAYTYTDSSISKVQVLSFKNGSWTQIGNDLERVACGAIRGYSGQNGIIATYIKTGNGQITVKTHLPANENENVGQKTVTYTVNYVAGSTVLESHTYQSAVEATASDRIAIQSGSISIKSFSGYHYVNTLPSVTEGAMVETGTVIKLNYEEDEPNILPQTKTLSYTVEYRAGSTVLESHTYQSTVEATANDSIAIQSGSISVKSFSGYHYVNITPAETEGALVPTNTVICLNYEKDEIVDTTPKTKSVSYTVNYMAGQTLLETHSYTDSILVGDDEEIRIQEGSVAKKTFIGYRYVGISPTVTSGTLVASGSIININYEKEEPTKTGEDSQDRRILIAEKAEGTIAYLDGKPVSLRNESGLSYVDIGNEVPKSLVIYSYNTTGESDQHKIYPTGMEVYFIHEENGLIYAEKNENFTNILKYAGASIRITGNKGIRMITGIGQEKKNQLVNGGLDGYSLVEYGTIACWANKLGAGEEPVIGGNNVVKAYAYRRGENDPVFRYSGGDMQYTNVLVGFSLSQCKDDFAMRPYMIVEKNGVQATIYGGTIYRSIGYIALQNKTSFAVGTEAYEYIWSIIHEVYPQVYASEYRRK